MHVSVNGSDNDSTISMHVHGSDIVLEMTTEDDMGNTNRVRLTMIPVEAVALTRDLMSSILAAAQNTPPPSEN